MDRPTFDPITAEQVTQIITGALHALNMRSVEYPLDKWEADLGLSALAKVTGIDEPTFIPPTGVLRVQFCPDRIADVVNRWQELINAAGIPTGPGDVFTGLVSYLSVHAQLIAENPDKYADDFVRIGAATLSMMDVLGDFWEGWTALQVSLITDHLQG